MDGIRIGNALEGLSGSGPAGKAKPQDAVADFKKTLGQSIEDLNAQLSKADQSAREMAMGEGDVHQAMIAMEEANLSLRLMIDVRNKILAAYDEIMRMQF